MNSPKIPDGSAAPSRSPWAVKYDCGGYEVQTLRLGAAVVVVEETRARGPWECRAEMFDRSLWEHLELPLELGPAGARRRAIEELSAVATREAGAWLAVARACNALLAGGEEGGHGA